MQLQSNDLQITKENITKNKAVYTFGPLPTGFGHTLGNTLRRVLLTSLEGAAITQVKIDGAAHQFSTITGVKEDVIDITLNLKEVKVKSHSENPVVVRISKTGPGVVTAADIEANSEIEILNPEVHIATLSDAKTKFNAELVVEKGAGYYAKDQRESSKIGVILLDAMFSPIVSATYEVEPTRLGRVIGLDKLVLTVETDGSMGAEDAITRSAGILSSFFTRFSDGEDEIVAVPDDSSDDASTAGSSEDVSLEELPLPTRTINALKKHGISTLHQLASKTSEDLADVKNLGDKSISEIKKLLEKEGLVEDEA